MSGRSADKHVVDDGGGGEFISRCFELVHLKRRLLFFPLWEKASKSTVGTELERKSTSTCVCERECERSSAETCQCFDYCERRGRTF